MASEADFLSFLVLGADTQVGTAMVRLLRQRGLPVEVSYRGEAGYRAELADRLTRSTAKFVINTLFEEPSDANGLPYAEWPSLNELVLSGVSVSHARLLTLSSSIVLDGKQERAYSEQDELLPQSSLAKTYQALEHQCAEHTGALTLRLGWLFSELPGNMLMRLADAAIQQEVLKFSDSFRGNPTGANSVARVLLAICEQLSCEPDRNALSGLYHYADTDGCSMFVFAKTAITALKAVTDVTVETIEEASFPIPEGEGENYQLNCRKILSDFGIKQLPWRLNIQEVLKMRYSTAAEVE